MTMAGENNRYFNRQKKLFAAMKQEGIKVLLLPMGDDHGSEYIPPYYQTIFYYTNFTGSAATVLFVEDDTAKEGGRVYLWTDGRYFLQAGQELLQSGGILMKQGMKDVPTIEAFLKKLADANNYEKGLPLGFDGSLIPAKMIESLQKTVRLSLKGDCTLCNDLWEQDADAPRPKRSFGRILELETVYAGMSSSEKIRQIREKMKEKGAAHLVLSDLDEIAWCLNLRGEDIAYHPVFYAFMILDETKIRLYVGNCEAKSLLDTAEGRQVAEVSFYDDFYRDLKDLPAGERVWVDENSASFRIMDLLSERSDLLKEPSPIALMKAVKNDTEIANMKKAHIKDGIALTKWIFWLKSLEEQFEKTKQAPPLSELSVSEKLRSFRRMQKDYLQDSFAPILAFDAHGAIVHYEPDETSDLALVFGEGRYLLADTGAHYKEGTTDVTRTISLGAPGAQQKKHYTAVLKGHLSLLSATFLEGAPGSSLDQLARQPLYRLGLDYRHGTGHGVGYLLSVHEGPNGFRMKYTKDNVILPGMITSDEPGVYLEGEYGIRLESLILSVEKQTTQYGTFLGFEPLTMAPFDRESILPEDLSGEERDALNAYHALVYETLGGYLTKEEKDWLFLQTRPI